MEKKTGCRRRIVIKEDFIFVGVCGHVTGAWWAPWGPGLSIFRFRRPYATFSSCRNLSGIQFKCRSEGGYFHGHRPSQPGLSSRCGMGRWSESLNRDDNVRTSGVRDPVQRWAKKGQSSVAIISSSPELLLILVGWFPNNMQRLTRIQKQTQEDVTTLWVRHWWCHTSMTGSGGFTPGTPVSTHKKELKR